MDAQHRAWMRRAIDVARRGWGNTHPNPVVGALIIENNEVVAEGYHAKAGQLHAERDAFRRLGRKPLPGATMVVTLEPCSTHGRTPPCVDAILENDIETLIVGAVDPNPEHAGRGLDILRERGVTVVQGVEADACEDLNLIFNHHILHPEEAFFCAKVATTLDGKVATRTGDSQWITGPVARQNVARWRRYFPAIMVGAGTVIKDNPSLTSRQEGHETWCPYRLVVDTKGLLQEFQGSHVFSDTSLHRTWVLTTDALSASKDYLSLFRERGGTVLESPMLEQSDYIDWNALRKWCASKGLSGIYVEPGPGLMRSLMEQRALNYIFQYVAPKIMGDSEAASIYTGRAPMKMNEVSGLNAAKVEAFGEDACIRGHLES